MSSDAAFLLKIHVYSVASQDPVDWGDAAALAARIQLRVAKYAGYIKLNDFDVNKKNLVLDIDYTVSDSTCCITVHSPIHYLYANCRYWTPMFSTTRL